MLRRRPTGRSGFTIVEAILVVAIVGIASAILIPALGKMIRVTKMTGTAREAASFLRKTRFEAIKRGVPVRVDIDLANNRLTAFADVHGDELTDPPDGVFKEIAGQPRGATDYEIVPWVAMPAGVTLQQASGFTGPDAANKEVVFDTNGSVEDAGAVRLADAYGNLLEVRITTVTAARVEVLKFDGTLYRSQGEEGSAWTWQ